MNFESNGGAWCCHSISWFMLSFFDEGASLFEPNLIWQSRSSISSNSSVSVTSGTVPRPEQVQSNDSWVKLVSPSWGVNKSCSTNNSHSCIEQTYCGSAKSSENFPFPINANLEFLLRQTNAAGWIRIIYRAAESRFTQLPLKYFFFDSSTSEKSVNNVKSLS